MAKAKKTEAGGSSKAKAAAGKKGKSEPATGVPQIDTSMAASTAAKFVAAKAAGIGGTPPSAASGGATKESAAFKSLKEGLSKPASGAASAMANLLDKAGPANLPKTHHTPFGTASQIGKNQTFGADVNRTGVPRRTGGG